MVKSTVKKAKNHNNIDLIQSVMNMNDGYITSKEITKYGIHRMFLKIMEERNIIKKISSGIYIDSNKEIDNYYVTSLIIPSAIYSHMTALYLYGFPIDEPKKKYDITVLKDYNSVNLRKHNSFHVQDKFYKLGLSVIRTPMGNKVKIYDLERCICDIIRSKKRMDSRLFKICIKEYFNRPDKDLVELMYYAKKMGIKDDVQLYIDMLSD